MSCCSFRINELFSDCNSEGVFNVVFANPLLCAGSKAIDLDCEIRHEIHIELSDGSIFFRSVFRCCSCVIYLVYCHEIDTHAMAPFEHFIYLYKKNVLSKLQKSNIYMLFFLQSNCDGTEIWRKIFFSLFCNSYLRIKCSALCTALK